MDRNCAIIGVGYTKLTGRSNRSVLELATEAVRTAIADAGLTTEDIDGIGSYSVGDSVRTQAVATVLGCTNVNYLLDLDLGGQAPCYLVLNADSAIRAGMARTVVLFRALNGRSGARIGRERLPGLEPVTATYRHSVGLDAFPSVIAMWARRFMIETGATEEDLGAVVMAQRWYAANNDRAVVKKELTLAEYLNSPMVVSPFRLPDCTREVDGAIAIVVTEATRATDSRHPPVYLAGGAYTAGVRSGQDMADILLWEDYAKNCMHFLRDRLWSKTGLTPADIDVAEIYDCFSSAVLFALEGLGIVGKGESGAFIRGGETRPGGRLPVNTNGGLLCEGYLHGMNALAEATLQLRGGNGVRQVEGARTALVTSGTLMDGSALVLARG
jgi:acetyl-CoA acetyltransferase